MTVDCVSEGRTLTAAVRGELDHHRAKEVMTELDEQIDMALPRRLTLDLSGLSFTDSSGIAVLIRVSRRMEQIKGELIVRGVPPQPWKVFQAAGLHKLIRFEQEEPAAAGEACFAAQLDPTLEEINDIKTAVSEAVTNAIVHAYPDRLGKVALKLRLKEGGILEILVRDWGVGIADVEQARTPLFTTGSEERSGMGFTIMESFMDVVKVRSTPGKGTQVTMRKRISPRIGGR